MQIYQISLTYHHSCTFLTEKTIHSQNSVNPLTINQIIPPTLLYTSPYNSKRPMLIFASAFYHFVFPLISKSVVPSIRETGTVPVFSVSCSRLLYFLQRFHNIHRYNIRIITIAQRQYPLIQFLVIIIFIKERCCLSYIPNQFMPLHGSKPLRQ